MRAVTSKPLTFAAIAVLVVTLVCSSSSLFYVYAVPPDEGWFNATNCNEANGLQECCWLEPVPDGTGIDGGDREEYCQVCWLMPAGLECDDKELQFFEFKNPGLGVLPEGGVLEEPLTAPTGPFSPLQGSGVL